MLRGLQPGLFLIRIILVVMVRVMLIVLAFVTLGCGNTNSKLIGEWYGTAFQNEGIVNYFTQLSFTNDSLFLRDENLLVYSLKYKVNKKGVVFNNKEYPIEFINDSTIKFLNIIFNKRSEWEDEQNGRYISKEVSLSLPCFNLFNYDSIAKTIRESKIYADDIVIGIKNSNLPVVVANGIEMQIESLSAFLGVNHQDMDTKRVANLFIDRDVKMGFVDSVFKEVKKQNIIFFNFVLGNNLNNELKATKSIYKFIPFNVLSDITSPDSHFFMMSFLEDYQQIINFKSDRLFLNEKEIDSARLITEIKKSILDNPSKTIIILLYHPLLRWEDFVGQLAAIENVYFNLRNERSLALYKKSFLMLTEEQQLNIKEFFPKKFLFFDLDFYQKLKETYAPHCVVD